MSYSDDILKDVFDTSEMDVRAKRTPKDISLKEEKKAMHRNREIASMYSANQFSDNLYSHNHFQDDPFFHEDAFSKKSNPFLNKDPFAELDGIIKEQQGKDPAVTVIKPASKSSKSKKSRIKKTKSSRWFKEDPVVAFNEVYGQIYTCASKAMTSPRQNPLVKLADRAQESWDILRAESDDYPYEDEEASQIHRLMSWNTHETAATVDTTHSHDANEDSKLANDGDSAKENMEVEKPPKRRVRFDYPIISSLRECPRPDPRDLPNLYFTEEELGQIEDDRESTYTADDVEVVCVPAAPGRKNSPPNTPETPRTARKRYIKSVQIYLRERSRDCPAEN